MVFVIIGKDAPDGQKKRPLHRPAHVERLRELADAGKLVLAGPFLDGAGSLIVMKTDSLEEAQAFADSDPYVIHGVFESVTIHPFQQVFPTPAPA